MSDNEKDKRNLKTFLRVLSYDSFIRPRLNDELVPAFSTSLSYLYNT